jgi:hypothetical protein
MSERNKNLSRNFRLILVVALIIYQCIYLNTCAKERCNTQELKRREQQATLENWQHAREAEAYQLAMMSQNSSEFMASKNAHWQMRKILQAQPRAISSAPSTAVLQTPVALPQIFYVSRKGPTNGTADGKSWKTAWPELDQIDWTTILKANNDNRLGNEYPGMAFNEPINVIVEIDGGSAGSSMTYYTPLTLPSTGNNPYRTHPLIRVANDAANLAEHGGQVILDGSKDKSGSPGIDASGSDGWFVWGSNGYGANWPNQNGHAEPGLAITNWPVGVYVSGLNYLWLDGLLISNCGVGILAAASPDIPFIKIGDKQLNVNSGVPIGVGFDAKTIIYYAGEGLHMHNCWIKNSYDMNYRANVWIANSAPGFMPDAVFPYGCPSLDGGCIVSVDDPNLVGKIDGIVYSNAQGSDLYHWFLVRGSVIGPGLRNGLVSNMPGGDIFVHGTLFINPAEANVVKLLRGQENVIYMANCASVIIPPNKINKCSKETPAFLNIVEGINDKIIRTTINGGTVNVKGDLVIGKIVHQINTTGNTTILGSEMIDDHNDPAVNQFVIDSDRSIIPPASAAAIAGLALGAVLGNGFASSYKCH